jgi:multicomponent Na+:H+ antiporter subunit B
MTSLILAIATRYLLPLLLLLAVYLLLHGHNVPGGGFVGGLVASAAFSLYTLANGAAAARKILVVNPRILMGIGLLALLASGVCGMLLEEPFLTGLWIKIKVPVLGKMGTPFFFDCGVFLVVIGVTLTFIFSLEED